MDSFTRRYLIGLSAAALLALVYFLFSGDPRVDAINDRLRADERLAAYPYQFEVRSLDDGIAVMGSPRSASVSAIQFLRAAFPELAGAAVNSDAMMTAQQELAELQSHAASLVRAEKDVNGVSWTLDRRWFEARGVYIEPGE